MARQRDPGPRTEGRRRLIEVLLAEREESGETYRELEERSGVPAQTLAWWQRRLREEDSKQVEFVEVAPAGIQLMTQSTLEIVLPDGAVLRIPSGFDPATLDAVFELLGLSC